SPPRIQRAFRTGAFRTAGAFLAGAAFLAAAASSGHTPLASLGASDGVSTASLKPLRAVMRARFEALILTGSPVAGLRPVRAARSTRANLAKPEIVIGSPFAVTPVITSVRPFSVASTVLASCPVWTATALTSWLRFNVPPRLGLTGFLRPRHAKAWTLAGIASLLGSGDTYSGRSQHRVKAGPVSSRPAVTHRSRTTTSDSPKEA